MVATSFFSDGHPLPTPYFMVVSARLLLLFQTPVMQRCSASLDFSSLQSIVGFCSKITWRKSFYSQRQFFNRKNFSTFLKFFLNLDLDLISQQIFHRLTLADEHCFTIQNHYLCRSETGVIVGAHAETIGTCIT